MKLDKEKCEKIAEELDNMPTEAIGWILMDWQTAKGGTALRVLGEGFYYSKKGSALNRWEIRKMERDS